MARPERCPFLKGELYGKGFESGGGKRDFHCPLSRVLFNASSGFPTEHGCLDGKYPRCRAYSQRVFELSMNVPLTCPAKNAEDERCIVTGKDCDHYWIDPSVEDQDYRNCEHFSKWFWQRQRTGEP